MKLKVLFPIFCICFISCSANKLNVMQQSLSNIVEENYEISELKAEEENTKLLEQNKQNNRIIQNFPNSLSEEKYLNTYKDFVLFLQDKHAFIEKNFDFKEGIRKYYKQNEVFACNTNFVNNDLLIESPIKIGMTKEDVYNLFNFPERSILEANTEVIDYSCSMYVLRNKESEEKFYASTTVEFFFDENKIITEIFLVTEEIEEPIEEDDWY